MIPPDRIAGREHSKAVWHETNNSSHGSGSTRRSNSLPVHHRTSGGRELRGRNSGWCGNRRYPWQPDRWWLGQHACDSRRCRGWWTRGLKHSLPVRAKLGAQKKSAFQMLSDHCRYQTALPRGRDYAVWHTKSYQPWPNERPGPLLGRVQRCRVGALAYSLSVPAARAAQVAR